MKIRLVRTDGPPHGYTTVGYWSFTKPDNKGDLIIEVANLPDWRFSLAVIGHEFLESIWCWLFHITTEECDLWDTFFEGEYSSGRISKEVEAGDDPRAPYFRGHRLGVAWEYVVIYGTFASWPKYARACFDVMGI